MRARRPLPLAALALGVGCGDIDVRVAETPPPETQALPAACDEQPAGSDSIVKVIVALDTSGSMQFTDPDGQRRAAVRELIGQLAERENVRVATFAFGTQVFVEPPITPGEPLFVPAAEWLEPSFLGLADVQTDFQSVLETVQLHLLTDMLAADPGDLARTRYVVTLLTDGTPTPVCCTEADETSAPVDPYGCALEPWEAGVDGAVYCEAQQEQAICNDQQFLDRFRENNPSGSSQPDYGQGVRSTLPSLVANGNYNRAGHLPAIVNEIRGEAAELGVGDLDVNVVLLFDPTLPDDVQEINRLNQCRAQFVAQSLAGDDTFVQFLSASDIDFTAFDYAPLCPLAPEGE